MQVLERLPAPQSWWVTRCDEGIGLVPQEYLQPLEFDALALAPFDAQQPAELTFDQGDVLTIHCDQAAGDGWWRASCVRDGTVRSGLVPRAYVDRNSEHAVDVG